MKSPTARSLDYCRRLGMQAGVVEYYNQYARRRHDLFGFVDIVAVASDPQLILIQCTTQANRAARETKILERHAELAVQLLDCHCWVECWGWRKNSKGRWQLTRRRLRRDLTWMDV